MNSPTFTLGVRSPQQIGPLDENFSSDEIQTSPPQRPPRVNRQRAGSATSLSVGIQHYQYSHHQQQSSPWQSPRSTPNSYNMTYSSMPSSPMSFQLPPSAREDHPRAGSISYGSCTSPPIQIQIPRSSSSSAASSYRTPRLSPGLCGGMGSGGLTMSSMPPLSLPSSFLEEQPDYVEYYSDVGLMEQQRRHLQHRQREAQAPHSSPIHPHHPPSMQRRSTVDYPTAGALNRHTNQLQIPSNGLFLPSPHLSPSTSPLSSDFPSLSIGMCSSGLHVWCENAEHGLRVNWSSKYQANEDGCSESFFFFVCARNTKVGEWQRMTSDSGTWHTINFTWQGAKVQCYSGLLSPEGGNCLR